MTFKGEPLREDPVNILHCCGGHEDHIDSCPMLWESDLDRSEIERDLDWRDLWEELSEGEQ